MITILVTLLVFLSLGLIVTVPVALATPGKWEESKSKFNQAFQVWAGLVVIIAAADGITSSI